MAETTNIQWCDHTFNPWIGCTKVSEGCRFCYAEADMDTRRGRARWGPNGTRSKTSASYWKQPLKWNRDADREGVRQRVFCASLADVFEDWDGPIVDHKGEVLYRAEDGRITTEVDWTHPLTMADLRRDLFALIDATPNLDWMLLTKRPENIWRMWPAVNVQSQQQADDRNERGELFRRNVWLYTSVSEQESADRNIPKLLECRDLAAKLGASAEPLLGEINLREVCCESGQIIVDSLGGVYWHELEAGCAGITPPDGSTGDQVLDHAIVGGESGASARSCDIMWISSIVRQCQAAGVPVFVKQFGSSPQVDETYPGQAIHLVDAIKHPKGGDPAEWPEELRVREFPRVLEEA